MLNLIINSYESFDPEIYITGMLSKLASRLDSFISIDSIVYWAILKSCCELSL